MLMKKDSDGLSCQSVICFGLGQEGHEQLVLQKKKTTYSTQLTFAVLLDP